MADTTFGVKVPEELKEQITKMMQDSGLTGKDFMQSLINVYQVEKTKDQLPEVAQELKELQLLTQRINNIYLNLGYRIDNMMKSKDEETGEQLRKKDDLISKLQVNIGDLETKTEMLTEAFNNAVNQKDELMQRVNELTDSNNNIKALVEEYKGKNDMLLGQLKQYEKYPEEIDNLKSELAKAQRENVEKDSMITVKEQAINALKDKVNELVVTLDDVKENSNKEKENLKAQYKDNLQQLKVDLSLERERAIDDINRVKNSEMREAILKLKEEQQEKMQSIQAEYLGKINEYQDKYRALLEELEEVKAAQKKKS